MVDPHYQMNEPEAAIGVALLLSAALHVGLGGFLFFFLPRWADQRKADLGEVVTVQLLGSLSPPAPAAPPAPVNPKLKGPDVVEAPRSDPPPAQPPQPQPQASTLIAPAKVIPLGPKAPEKSALQKTPVAPPKVTPPEVKADPPPRPSRPKPNPDEEINKRIAALERKVEADQADAAIDSRLFDIAKRQGQGQGESSETSGGTSGGQRVHPEKEAYYRHIRDIVKSNWIPPPGSLATGLQAIFIIKIEPSGRVSGLNLNRSSGNSDYDLSVQRAIGLSNLPPLPPIFEGRADTPGLRFGLEEMQR